LQQRGFETLAEILDSKSHGIANLAAELDVPLPEAIDLFREVQGCWNTSNDATTTTTTTTGDIRPSNIAAMTPTKKDGCDRDETSATDNHDSTPKSMDSYSSLGIVTAYDMLNRQKQEHSRPTQDHNHISHVVTFSRAVDRLLGGGIALGEVTELFGMPGSGKSQLAMQISFMARIPNVLGGVQGGTLYVDCDGSFVPERARVMAQALAEHVRLMARRDQRRRGGGSYSRPDLDEALRGASILSAYEMMKAVSVYRVHDETALLATLFSLNEHIKQRQHDVLPVRLVVIDTIAFHFRAVGPTDPQYYFKRTKTLTTLASYLGELASKYNLAVVVINQMTTKVLPSDKPGGSSSSMVVPALGESWKHATTTRLMLSVQERYTAPNQDDSDSDYQEDNCTRKTLRLDRTCTLVKSTHRPSGTAFFQIVDAGIRDVVDERRRPRECQDTSTGSSSKRRRSM
jgi:RAD51-like protein 2